MHALLDAVDKLLCVYVLIRERGPPLDCATFIKQLFDRDRTVKTELVEE